MHCEVGDNWLLCPANKHEYHVDIWFEQLHN